MHKACEDRGGVFSQALLDYCGGHADPFHYHERMNCLYTADLPPATRLALARLPMETAFTGTTSKAGASRRIWTGAEEELVSLRIAKDKVLLLRRLQSCSIRAGLLWSRYHRGRMPSSLPRVRWRCSEFYHRSWDGRLRFGLPLLQSRDGRKHAGTGKTKVFGSQWF